MTESIQDNSGNHTQSVELSFNDLEWPRKPISRWQHFSTLNISKTTQDRAIATIKRQKEVVCAVSHDDISNDIDRSRNPVVKVTAFLKSNISKTGQIYYKTLTGNHTQSIEWYHFQWPWVTWPGFQGHDIFEVEYRKTGTSERQSYYCTRWHYT